MSADTGTTGDATATDAIDYDGKFDAIVVGAGLSGSAAALTMAEEGLESIVIERGQAPGTKNVFGGVLFTPTIRELVDLEDAPLERYVAEKRYGFLSERDETAVSMRPGEWLDEPHNDAYTVLRGDFDEWFAEQAEEAGATVITETTVTDVLRDEDGRVVGVDTDRPNGELRAPVVVLAEGANSLVGEGAGLRDHHERDEVAVTAKEVLKFDRDTIEERFRLHGEAGAAFNYFGEGAVGDAVGGGYVYTNKRTVSVGVVYRIEDAAQGQSPDEVLDEFKQHPAIAPLVRDGHLVEYSAHAIPEGGAEAMPDLVRDGALIVGDAAGLVLNNGVHLEGTNMAVESGYHAGRAVASAMTNGGVDDRALATYETELENSFVVQNLEHYNWFQETIAEDRKFIFQELPRALADAETEYFRMDRQPKEDHVQNAKDRLLEAVGGRLGALKRAWKYRKMLS